MKIIFFICILLIDHAFAQEGRILYFTPAKDGWAVVINDTAHIKAPAKSFTLKVESGSPIVGSVVRDNLIVKGMYGKQYRIIDTKGRLIRVGTFQRDITVIPVINAPSGVLFLSIDRSTYKFIKL